jgi:hypothetical protein
MVSSQSNASSRQPGKSKKRSGFQRNELAGGGKDDPIPPPKPGRLGDALENNSEGSFETLSRIPFPYFPPIASAYAA